MQPALHHVSAAAGWPLALGAAVWGLTGSAWRLLEKQACSAESGAGLSHAGAALPRHSAGQQDSSGSCLWGCGARIMLTSIQLSKRSAMCSARTPGASMTLTQVGMGRLCWWQCSCVGGQDNEQHMRMSYSKHCRQQGRQRQCPATEQQRHTEQQVAVTLRTLLTLVIS